MIRRITRTTLSNRQRLGGKTTVIRKQGTKKKGRRLSFDGKVGAAEEEYEEECTEARDKYKL